MQFSWGGSIADLIYFSHGTGADTTAGDAAEGEVGGACAVRSARSGVSVIAMDVRQCANDLHNRGYVAHEYRGRWS